MGFALPAAIAAKLARPGAPVVCLLGDGCFQMTCGEVATAKRLSLTLPIVVLDDRWLALIKVKQIRRQFPLYGTELQAEDYREPPSHYFGVPAVGVDSAAALEAAVRKALAANGPTVIEAVIDSDHYVDTVYDESSSTTALNSLKGFTAQAGHEEPAGATLASTRARSGPCNLGGDRRRPVRDMRAFPRLVSAPLGRSMDLREHFSEGITISLEELLVFRVLLIPQIIEGCPRPPKPPKYIGQDARRQQGGNGDQRISVVGRQGKRGDQKNIEI